MATEENQIFKQIQSDQREALNRLLDLYFVSLCHFTNAYLYDPMLSEEIVSDVFFNLWAKRKTLKITGNIKPYLFKATRNQAISYLRRPGFHYEEIAELLDISVKTVENQMSKALQLLPTW